MSQEVFEIAVSDGDLNEEEIYEVLDDNDISKSKLKKHFDKFFEKARKVIDDKEKVKDIIAKAKTIFFFFFLIPFLGKYPENIATFCDLITDYIDKKYTKVPKGTILCVLGAIIYLVVPIDLIPDALPGLGFVDDIGLLTMIMAGMDSDIKDYRKWKASQAEAETETKEE